MFSLLQLLGKHIPMRRRNGHTLPFSWNNKYIPLSIKSCTVLSLSVSLSHTQSYTNTNTKTHTHANRHILRWKLLWIMPMVQNRSLDLLTSSPERCHYTKDALFTIPSFADIRMNFTEEEGTPCSGYIYMYINSPFCINHITPLNHRNNRKTSVRINWICQICTSDTPRKYHCLSLELKYRLSCINILQHNIRHPHITAFPSILHQGHGSWQNASH